MIRRKTARNWIKLKSKTEASNSSNKKKTWLRMRNDQEGFGLIHPCCEWCILSIHRRAVRTYELDFSSQLRLVKATQESIQGLLCLRVRVCLCWCLWHVRGVIDVPQCCLEAGTNVPNYKTTCENWQGTDEKERERKKEQSQGEVRRERCVYLCVCTVHLSWFYFDECVFWGVILKDLYYSAHQRSHAVNQSDDSVLLPHVVLCSDERWA